MQGHSMQTRICWRWSDREQMKAPTEVSDELDPACNVNAVVHAYKQNTRPASVAVVRARILHSQWPYESVARETYSSEKLKRTDGVGSAGKPESPSLETGKR